MNNDEPEQRLLKRVQRASYTVSTDRLYVRSPRDSREHRSRARVVLRLQTQRRRKPAAAMAGAEELVLLRVDEQCATLQQDGRYLEALDYMERSLVLRRCLYGNDSEQAVRACKQVVDTCNGLATAYLTQSNFEMAMQLIKKAETLSEPYEFLRAVTYNNLACYYRRQNKLRTALKYLEKALKLSSPQTDAVNRASTHLNLCAVLSQLGRHSVALEQAQAALILLQEELFSQVIAPLRGIGSTPSLNDLADKIAVLSIAYHNAGVEQEHLKRFDAALQSYSKASELSELHLGEDHEIARTLGASRDAAEQQIQDLSMKRGGKSAANLNSSSASMNRSSRASTAPGKRPATSGSMFSERELNISTAARVGTAPAQSSSLGGLGGLGGGGQEWGDMMSPRGALETEYAAKNPEAQRSAAAVDPGAGEEAKRMQVTIEGPAAQTANGKVDESDPFYDSDKDE